MTAARAFVSSFSRFRARDFSGDGLDGGAVRWHPELGAETVDFLAHDVAPRLQDADVLLGAFEAGLHGVEFAPEGVALGFDGAELIEALLDLCFEIVDARAALFFFDADLANLFLQRAEFCGGFRQLVPKACAFLFAQLRFFLRCLHGTLGGINASLRLLADAERLGHLLGEDGNFALPVSQPRRDFVALFANLIFKGGGLCCCSFAGLLCGGHFAFAGVEFVEQSVHALLKLAGFFVKLIGARLEPIALGHERHLFLVQPGDFRLCRLDGLPHFFEGLLPLRG